MCNVKYMQNHVKKASNPAGVKRNKGEASTMAMIKPGDNAKAGLIIMEACPWKAGSWQDMTRLQTAPGPAWRLL